MSNLTKTYEYDRPFFGLSHALNRLFSDLGNDVAWPAPARPETAYAWVPRLDVSEDKEQILVTAELPGLTDKDVEVGFTEGVLTIKGEKRSEREQQDRTWYATERVFGSFLRTLAIHADIDDTKLTATFKHGVLQVSLPKSRNPKAGTKRIAITTG